MGHRTERLIAEEKSAGALPRPPCNVHVHWAVGLDLAAVLFEWNIFDVLRGQLGTAHEGLLQGHKGCRVTHRTVPTWGTQRASLRKIIMSRPAGRRNPHIGVCNELQRSRRYGRRCGKTIKLQRGGEATQLTALRRLENSRRRASEAGGWRKQEFRGGGLGNQSGKWGYVRSLCLVHCCFRPPRGGFRCVCCVELTAAGVLSCVAAAGNARGLKGTCFSALTRQEIVGGSLPVSGTI